MKRCEECGRPVAIKPQAKGTIALFREHRRGKERTYRCIDCQDERVRRLIATMRSTLGLN